MEARLTLFAVILSVAIRGCLSEYCTTGRYDTSYCSYGCCGSSPYQYCCSYSSVSVDNTSTSAVLAGWVIALIVIGVILVVSTIIAIVCCVRRSRGAEGTVVSRQGMTTMTIPGTVYTTNGQQQPSSWQYPQNSAPYQQPAPSPQQPMTSNFQQQYYPTGLTHGQTAGCTSLPSYPVNDSQLGSLAPPAYDNFAHGEPLKY